MTRAAPPVTTREQGPARPAPARRAGALAHRDFRLLWLGQLVSNLGASFLNLALLWLVKELTGSALLMGTVMACYALPFVLVGGIAGVFTDRWEKRWVMIGSDLARAGVLGLFLILSFTDRVSWQILLPMAAVMGSATAFFEPARQGSLVYLVDGPELTQANSLTLLTRQAAQMAGPVLAGLVVAAWGVDTAVAVNLGAFLISATLMGFMRLRTPRNSSGPGLDATLADLKEGLQTVSRHPVLRWVLPLGVLGSFLVAPIFVLLALYTDEVSSLGAIALGYLQGAAGAGMLLGSLVLSVLGGGWRKGRTGITALFGMSAATVGLGVAPSLGLAVASFAAWGFFTPLLNVPLTTLVQQETPAAQHGRVFGVFLAGMWAAQPVAMSLGGVLGDTLGVRAIYTGSGIIFLGLALFAAALRPLREAR